VQQVTNICISHSSCESGLAVSEILPATDLSVTQVNDNGMTDLPFVELPVSMINDAGPSSTDVASTDVPRMPVSEINDAAPPANATSAGLSFMPVSEVLPAVNLFVTEVNDPEPPTNVGTTAPSVDGDVVWHSLTIYLRCCVLNLLQRNITFHDFSNILTAKISQFVCCSLCNLNASPKLVVRTYYTLTNADRVTGCLQCSFRAEQFIYFSAECRP
jgi:hypothetical protein